MNYYYDCPELSCTEGGKEKGGGEGEGWKNLRGGTIEFGIDSKLSPNAKTHTYQTLPFVWPRRKYLVRNFEH